MRPSADLDNRRNMIGIQLGARRDPIIQIAHDRLQALLKFAQCAGNFSRSDTEESIDVDLYVF